MGEKYTSNSLMLVHKIEIVLYKVEIFSLIPPKYRLNQIFITFVLSQATFILNYKRNVAAISLPLRIETTKVTIYSLFVCDNLRIRVQ